MNKVCQFYIVLGDREYKGQNDGNVYINATGVIDVNLIRDAVFKHYHRKSKESIQVSDHIIFLVPDHSFDEQCRMIIEKLNLVGEIQYFPKKEEAVLPDELLSSLSTSNNTTDKSDLLEEKPSPELKLVENTEKDFAVKIEEEKADVDEFKNSDKDVSSINESRVVKDNVYRGDVDRPILKKNGNRVGVQEEEYAKDAANYMGYNPTLINRNVKSLVKSSRSRKNAFISLPVIVFILSAILLVSSVVILFVLD